MGKLYHEAGTVLDRSWEYAWPCHFSELQADGHVLVRMRRIVDMWDTAVFMDLGTRPGKQVKRGEILACVDGCKLSADFLSPIDGTVTQVLVSDGQQIRIGEPMYVLKPDAPLASLPAEDPDPWSP